MLDNIALAPPRTNPGTNGDGSGNEIYVCVTKGWNLGSTHRHDLQRNIYIR